MPPVIESKLFGRIPLGTTALRTGTQIRYPGSYIEEPDGSHTTVVSPQYGEVAAVNDTRFEVLRGSEKILQDKTNTNQLEVPHRLRFLITKMVKWK